MKKIAALSLSILLGSTLAFSSAYAFTDLEEGQATAVLALKERGIVSGFDNLHFVPKGKISYAQSVQMIVKGLNLNLDNMKFIKQPLASDSYTNIPNDSWYANAFVIAHYHNLDIPKDVNPNATITREQFGNLLVKALETKGQFPLVKMYIPINDEDQLTVDYQGTIQRLLLYKITALDGNGNFKPKTELTRGEAANWLYNAIRVLEAHVQKPPQVEEVKVTIEKVNADVNKVVLSRGEKPNAGYGIRIDSIQFPTEGQAIVKYTLLDPKPDHMYAQVITEAKAETYVSSKYEVKAEASEVK
ncbi:S-layer homology domain-containing protein [Paenibacillus qinlingensis]|uniref:SLH domain-containing protein n=1 Tax=Paenibacillus qinlingensis TaxID=1837343 RepID=A0ABU1NS36_9BACL|nr:S-layer homology domain-containing protein [Paenibacillus qinlingensis]MDR6549842.1 hypothetical protein [Paenibacillus qinlingensis]